MRKSVQTHQTVSHMRPDSLRWEAGPTLPGPGETLWFGVSSTHTRQGSILRTHEPVFVEDRHLCIWRDWGKEEIICQLEERGNKSNVLLKQLRGTTSGEVCMFYMCSCFGCMSVFWVP